jgi:putative membrane protein
MNPVELASKIPYDRIPYDQLANFDFAQIGIQTLAIVITAFLLPGLTIRSIFAPVLAVVILGFVNTKVWDAALFLQLPDTFSMQALTLVLCNGVLFWLVVKILPGFDIQGILPAILGPIIFSITSIAIDTYFQKHTLSETVTQVSEIVAPIKAKVSEGVEKVKLGQKKQVSLPSPEEE